MDRKNYIDNIRWITVLLVIFYHVIYIFNSAGVISNFDIKGIAGLDVYLYFVYPWFMALLFVVAGISARYSLLKRSGREFMKDRARRLLVPSLGGFFLLSWIAGAVTNYYTDMFMGQGSMIPGVIKYLIYCMCGIGPLWFAQELFLACMVLLLLRKADKNDRLSELGKKVNLPVLLLMVIPFWGSSMILNTPLIEVYRHGFYGFSFLLGYYVFSHDTVMERLKKVKFPLLGAACVCGAAYTAYYFGENYAGREILQHFTTNGYAWLMILAIMACAKDCLDFGNPLSRYMTKASFGFYVLHYPLLCVVAFTTYRIWRLPMIGYYIVNLLLLAVLLPLVYECIKRIPGIRYLLLGIKNAA